MHKLALFGLVVVTMGCSSCASHRVVQANKVPVLIATASASSRTAAAPAPCKSMAQAINWINMPPLSADLPSDPEIVFQSAKFYVQYRNAWTECSGHSYATCPDQYAYLDISGITANTYTDNTTIYSTSAKNTNDHAPPTRGRVEITYANSFDPFTCVSQVTFGVDRGKEIWWEERIPANTYLVAYDLYTRAQSPDLVQWPWKLCNHNTSGKGCMAPGTYTGVGMELDYGADDPLDFSHGFSSPCTNRNSFPMDCRAVLYYRYQPPDTPNHTNPSEKK